jgi:hypothetical protein
MARLRDQGSIPGFLIARLTAYRPIRPRKAPAGGRIKIPDRLNRRAPIMRLVTRGVAQYDEIRRFWDINEVWEANELLDIQDDVDWWSSEEMRRKSKAAK